MSLCNIRRITRCGSCDWCECRNVTATYGDVEDGDYVEGRGEDGAHAFDGRLVQAVIGGQHLPVRDNQPKNILGCCVFTCSLNSWTFCY